MGMLSCEQIDTLFIESEQQVTEDILSRSFVKSNSYWGKIPEDGNFPLNSGTQIKGYKFGRVGFPQGQGWRPVVDEICNTNACDFNPDVITHGSSDFLYSLVQQETRTDWLCIDSLNFRQFPEQEIGHLMNGLTNANQLKQEEFRRSRYIFFCGNKYVATVERDTVTPFGPLIDYTTCGDLTNNGFVFEERGDTGEINENYVRVCVNPTDLDLISELTMDMLDVAPRNLEYVGEKQTLGNTGLYDALLPDQQMANRLIRQEALLQGTVEVSGGINILDLRMEYGTDRVVRNFSLRTDNYAMKFYPDTVVNATLATFSVNNPTTWPRFFRVYPYKEVKTTIGVDWVPDSAYQKAPFGISTILTKRVISIQGYSGKTSFGSAQSNAVSYSGVAKWKNPDWECNPLGNKGYWYFINRMAAKPWYTDEGFAYFHRINHKIGLQGNACPIPTSPTYSAVTPYCYSLTNGVDNGLGANMSIDN